MFFLMYHAILFIDIGTPCEQQPYDLLVSVGCSPLQRRTAGAVRTVNLSRSGDVEEEPYWGDVSGARRQVQRRPAELIPGEANRTGTS